EMVSGAWNRRRASRAGRGEGQGTGKGSPARRYRPPVERLEDRCLLSFASPDQGQGRPIVGLVDVKFDVTDSANVGALFPSISADGRSVAFESGSFVVGSLPGPSDLVQGLTVSNDAPNVYVRDRLSNTTT